MKPAKSSVVRTFRDPVKSRIQAVLSEYLQTQQGVSPEEVHQHPVMVAAGQVLSAKGKKPAAPGGVGGQLTHCLEILVQYLEALVELDFKTAGEKRDEFKDLSCDPGWLEAAAVWFWHYHVRHKKPSYVTLATDEGVYSLPPGAASGRVRVGLIADWGTGTQASEIVLNEVFKQKPDVILHLGDIYYAGTHHEERTNLMALLTKARSANGLAIPFYNLPGNHDYYSGGEAFYDFLGKLNAGIDHAAVQQASYFVLRNDSWQLQGMDTGYNDHDLETVGLDFTFLRNDEAAWHQHQIAAAGERKIMLFSHHQLFSSLVTIGKTGWFNPCLVSAFQRPLGQGLIRAWFWGHEHLLEIYQTPTAMPQPSDWPGSAIDGACATPLEEVHLQWPKGRCIGCGGFPVEAKGSDPYTQRKVPVALIDDPAVQLGKTRDGEVYNHGYVVMDLMGPADQVGPQARASYYEVPGDGLPFAGGDAKGKFSRLRYQETIL